MTAGGGVARAYWQLDPTRELRPGSDAEYAEQFRELFTDAVRCRLRSASPVAAALSGGLDSSSVVCVARAVQAAAGTGPLATYTARFPTIPRCDEGAYVAAVEAQGGLAPRHLRGDTLDPLGDLERDARAGGRDVPRPGYYMHGALYRAARADGVRVFLEGTGGDLVVSHGTGYLHDLARQGRWLALGREVRAALAVLRAAGWRTLRGVAASVAPAAAPSRLATPAAPGVPRAAADPGRLRPADRSRRAASGRGARRPGGDVEGARREHWRHLTSPRLGRHPGDACRPGAAAAGVDVRDPFLDRRLMEFCLALPASQKIRHGRTRVVARHALGSLLPPEIRDRPGRPPST